MALAEPLQSARRTRPWPSSFGPPEEHGPGRAVSVRPKNTALAEPLRSARKTWPWPGRFGPPEEHGPGRAAS
eukprot:7591872-Alexandrium_andersonii.AAC.1